MEGLFTPIPGSPRFSEFSGEGELLGYCLTYVG